MLLETRQDGTKVYGPYFNKRTGRRYVDLHYSSQQCGQQTYARWLYEQTHGPLPKDWDVHHDDEDKLNDDINNLVAKPRGIHQEEHYAAERGIERGWQHGTLYGWMKKKCDCKVCLDAKWAWHDKRNEKRRSGKPYKPRR